MMKDHLIFKFNSGIGAVLCSNCRKIIMSGGRIPEYIWNAKNIEDIPPMFCCKECEGKYNKRKNDEE